MNTTLSIPHDARVRMQMLNAMISKTEAEDATKLMGTDVQDSKSVVDHIYSGGGLVGAIVTGDVGSVRAAVDGQPRDRESGRRRGRNVPDVIHSFSSQEEITHMAKVITNDQAFRDPTRHDAGKLATYVRRTLEHRSHAVLLAKSFGPSAAIKDGEGDARQGECDEEHA